MAEKYDIELFSEHTPPRLEHTLGYHGHRRWVAFFWGKKIEDCILCYGFDGKSFNPVNLAAWDAFFGHGLIVAMNHKLKDGHARKRFEFGDEQLSSEYWLLLDRLERKLYAARKDSALHHLRSANDSAFGQHPGAGFDPSVASESDPPEHRGKSGATQMISDMIQWLDKRKEALIQAGQWPIWR